VRGQRQAQAAPYPRERPDTHCTGGWVGLRASLDWCGKSRPTGIRSPDGQARRQSLYRLRYPALCLTEITCDIFVCVVCVWQRDFLDLWCVCLVRRVENSAHQAHTHHRVSPDPLHQLLSKLAILELYRTNLTFLFTLQPKKSRCQTPTTHTKYHK